VLGSLCTIITYILFKQSRSYGTKLVFLLSIADLGISLALLQSLYVDYLPENVRPAICNLEGVMIQFFEIAAILWSFTIGVSIYLIFLRDFDPDVLERKAWLARVVIYGFAGISAAVPLARGKYSELFPGAKYSWCWIGDATAPERYFMYLPDLVVFFTLCIMYPVIIAKARNWESREVSKFTKNMALYLLVFIICQVPAMVDRLVYHFFLPNANTYAISMVHFSVQPLQGFLDCLVFCWNEPIFMSQYKMLFQRAKSRLRMFKKPLKDRPYSKVVDGDFSTGDLNQRINYEDS